MGSASSIHRKSRARSLGGESRRLVDRLFGGRAAPLVAHLAAQEALTESDIAEIEALLETLKRKGEGQ